MLRYIQLIWTVAIKDAKTFWTGHKIITFVPAPLIGFGASAIVSKGLHSMVEFRQAVEISSLSGVAAFALTVAYSLLKAPKLLNDARVAEIKRLAEENQRISASQKLNVDFHLETDPNEKTGMPMRCHSIGGSLSVSVSTVYLVVTNKGQTHFEVVGYRFAGGEEIAVECSVSPHGSARLNISEKIVEALLGSNYDTHLMGSTEFPLQVAISCLGDGEGMPVLSDYKGYKVEVTKGSAAINIKTRRL